SVVSPFLHRTAKRGDPCPATVTARADLNKSRRIHMRKIFRAQVGRLDMTERRITQLFGLVLGAIVTCTLVLNAFAFKPKTVLSETENPLSQKKETPGGGLSNKPIASAACAAVLWFH